MANNVESILKELLKSDAVKGISKTSGVSLDGVESVLKNALPSLINGASKQTTDAKTKDSFFAALDSHGSKDLSNLTSFFKNVDVSDGAKIISHLLGNKQDATSNKVAKETGIDAGDVAKIMAVAAPLLMSVIGKKAKENKTEEKDTTANLASALLGGIDVNGLLKNFIK